MSIRVRLIWSYIAMILIPFALLATAVYVLLSATSGGVSFAERFDSDGSMSADEARLYGELAYISEHDPERLLGADYWSALEPRLSQLHAGVISEKNGARTYASDFLRQYAESGQATKDRSHAWWGSARIGGSWYTPSAIEVAYPDGESGRITLFRGSGSIPVALRPILLLVILLAIASTNAVLTMWISRSIIKPLYALKKAAEQIKDGDLNFTVKPTTRDEIGELSVAFEEMRYRLKESLDRGMQYEENRKELIANISHDLKTPITAIKGYVEGLRDGIANSPEKMDKYIRTIYSKAEDLDRLIDELFLYSKLDLNKAPFHLETVELNRCIGDGLEELQFDAEKAGVTIVYRPSAVSQMHVAADREKLKRVLGNIVENSLKYMKLAREQSDASPSTGLVTVELIDGEREATVRIEDNGPGIDAAELPYIFDRFYRVDRSRNSNTGGSGLGLAIVKQIVEGHGGRIWAESAVGRGTTVYFTLRKASAGEEAKANGEKDTDH